MSSHRAPRISVVGSLNIDLVTTTPRVPSGGETLTASSFATNAGGKGANQAVACARASRDSHGDNAVAPGAAVDSKGQAAAHEVKVSMLGAVGDDAHGNLLLSTLKLDGIDCEGVARTDLTTGVAVILVEQVTGENRILFTPGANSCVQGDRLPHLSTWIRPDLIVLQLEIPRDTVIDIIKQAKQLGVDVLLNPAPAAKLPDETLQGLAHLVLNETEAAIMCDLDALTPRGDLEDFLDKSFATLAKKGVRNIVITLGSKGVAFASPESHEERKWKLIGAQKIDHVVDTTAAGDTFVGYYAVGIVTSMESSQSKFLSQPLENIVRAANRAAALTVTRKGAMSSIPYRDEMRKEVA